MEGHGRGDHGPQLVVWGFCAGYRFQREEGRGRRHCREAAEGFGAFTDGVNIVQDRFGPEVVGSVCPLFGVPALSWNMVVAMCMASPILFCRFAARESIESLPPNTGSVGSHVLEGLVGPCRLVRIALAVAITNEVGECDSIST